MATVALPAWRVLAIGDFSYACVQYVQHVKYARHDSNV